MQRYEAIGRKAFLEEQLLSKEEKLPAGISTIIQKFETTRLPPQQQITEYGNAVKASGLLKDSSARQLAAKTIRKRGDQMATEVYTGLLLRSAYSPNQLQEQLLWFWLNHFSVFYDKRNMRWLLDSYVKDAIRPNILGNFHDLVMATLKSPAMLTYLDNAQNEAGSINENYARELLELHTLGVNGGYTQDDVQQLARVLTGVGVRYSSRPTDMLNGLKLGYLREGAFEFDPSRHTPGDKTLLGRTIPAGGFDEVEKAVALIVSQPACARYVSQRLATYFIADNPSPALVEEMAKTFQKTGGNMREVMRTMLLSPQTEKSMSKKFKDPQHFVVSFLRLAGPDYTASNHEHALRWLKSLGQSSFGRLTPDGYPLTSNAWTSAGQLSLRFDTAREMTSNKSSGALNKAAPTAGIIGQDYYRNIALPHMSQATRKSLEATKPPHDRDMLFLASPEFNYY